MSLARAGCDDEVPANPTSGLGAVVAQKFASEGSNVAINYFSGKDAAEALALDLQSRHKVKAVVIQGVCIFVSDRLAGPGLLITVYRMQA